MAYPPKSLVDGQQSASHLTQSLVLLPIHIVQNGLNSVSKDLASRPKQRAAYESLASPAGRRAYGRNSPARPPGQFLGSGTS